MFRLTALVALLSSATALKADSPAGQALLSKSSRSLEEGEASYDWMMDYSMVFQSCHNVNNFAGNEAGDGGDAIQYLSLIKYKLCPASKCRSGCKGAEYVTDMASFVDSWTEWTMNDKEYKCEQVRESCGCDDYYGDENVCYSKCFANAGMSDCIDEEKNDDAFEFNLQEWLQCKKSDALDSYGNALYVGPKCSSSGEQINLGVFKDEYCTVEYSSEIFAQYYGGTKLPYQNTNILAENCISCKDAANAYYPEVTEICQETYPASAKCETNLAKYISSPVTAGCEYINNIRLYEKDYKNVSGFASNAFAVVFGFATIALAVFAAHLYKLNNRKINLHTNAAIV